MNKDDINNISEISAGVIAARRDYQQDPEGSDIFMYYRKDIPAYDDENGLFDISVPGRNRNPDCRVPLRKNIEHNCHVVVAPQ